MLLDAIKFAYNAHKDQKRFNSNLPYIVHPMEVMCTVEEHYHKFTDPHYTLEEIMSAAILHDTIEDCEKVTHASIFNNFNPNITYLVDGLTKVSKLSDGNRKKRKQIDREYLRTKNVYVHFIKCADILSNIRTIEDTGNDFAIKYLNEKLEDIKIMKYNPLSGRTKRHILRKLNKLSK